jgi:hypothetical protein
MSKTILFELDCGGYGRGFGQMVRSRIGEITRLAWRIVDSSVPPDMPAARCIELAPQSLSTTPTGVVGEAIRMTPLNADAYSHYRGLVSADGLAQLPSMSAIATFAKLPVITQVLERDIRALAAAVGGAERCLFLTVASALGGTGTPAARVAGLALRLAARGASLPQEVRWMHVFVSSTVLGDACRSRRTLALERQQLEEFEALMTPGALLRVPGQLDPIEQPGPDEIILIASSPEAPRTLADAADELAAIIRHWLFQ